MPENDLSSAVERVEDLSQVRISKANVVLYDMDALKVHLMPRPLFECDNPIPVFEEGNTEECGYATVWADGQKVVACIFFRYDVPSRLLMQIDEPVYAIPGGDFFVAEYNGGVFCDDIYLPAVTLVREHNEPAGVGGRLENVE